MPVALTESMRRISGLLQSGQLSAAHSQLESLVSANPDYVEGLRLLAGTKQALGDLAQAESLENLLGGKLTMSDRLAVVQAEIALNTGNFPEAITLAEQAMPQAKEIGSILAEGMAQRVWGQALASLEPAHENQVQEHFTASLSMFETGEARLEAANKFLGTRICVSGAVADRAENFQGRPVGDLILRGRCQPLRAYEPLPAETFSAPTTAEYAAAFAKLEAGDIAAMPAFAALVGLHADDPLASFHLRRLLNGANGVSMRLE